MSSLGKYAWKGFTLVEVVIAATLGVSATAGAFFVLKNQSQSEARTAAISDFQRLQTEIRRILKDPAKCATMIRNAATGLPITIGESRVGGLGGRTHLALYDGDRLLVRDCGNASSCPANSPRDSYFGAIRVKAIYVDSSGQNAAGLLPGGLYETAYSLRIYTEIPGELIGQGADSSNVIINTYTNSPLLANQNAPIRFMGLAENMTFAFMDLTRPYVTSCLYREDEVTACVTPTDQSPAPTAPAEGSVVTFLSAGNNQTISFTNVGTLSMTINFSSPPGYTGPASIVLAPGTTSSPSFTCNAFPAADQTLTVTWSAGTSSGTFHYTLRAT